MGASARPACKCRARRHVLVFLRGFSPRRPLFIRRKAGNPHAASFERWHARRARQCPGLPKYMGLLACAMARCQCDRFSRGRRLAAASQTLPTDQSRICFGRPFENGRPRSFLAYSQHRHSRRRGRSGSCLSPWRCARRVRAGLGASIWRTVSASRIYVAWETPS